MLEYNMAVQEGGEGDGEGSASGDGNKKPPR